jgi:LPXTG-motif cell wall-anchored protein
MKTTKKIYLSMVLLVVGVFVMGNVLAFAVSSKYWEENPLSINPGETQEAYIVLQNMAGTETVNARVGILEGSEIATLNEPERIYEIPVGERVDVYFTINVPEESEIGGIQNIVFDVSTVNSQEEGPMTFGSGAQKLVPVLISEEAKENLSPWLYYLIAGIVLLGIVALVVLKKKKEK